MALVVICRQEKVSFLQLEVLKNHVPIAVASRERIEAIGVETVQVHLMSKKSIRIENVLGVPDLDRRSFSVSVLAKKVLEVILGKENCEVKHNDILIVRAERVGKLYVIASRPIQME